jgi:hypothetical protein
VNTPPLERLSKSLAAVSVLGIVVVALVAHPDLTPPMRLAVVVGLAAGWFASATRSSEIQATCLLAAPLLPAMLRGLTGREGPVLDLLWMAPLTTSIVRSTPWSRWVMPAGWRVSAGGWALGLALTWPIIVVREAGFDLGGLWDLGRNNSEIGISAPHAAMWSLYAAWTPLAGLLWVDVISARASRAPDAWAHCMWSLWVGGTLATLVALYQGLVDLQFASTPFWAARGRATGTMLDANAYGMVAMLAGPMAFVACLARPSGPRVALGSAALVANLAGVWLSGSRTAALCSVIGLVTLGAAMARASAGLRRKLLPFAIAGALAMGALIVSSSPLGPVRRLLESPDSSVVLALNREPYGTIALRMMRDYPATGVGAGGYNVIAPDYSRPFWGSRLQFDNAQNWWRQIAAEGGLLGSLAPFVLSALLAWCVVRPPPVPERRREAVLVRGSLVALGVASTISMPTQSPVVMLWLCSLAGWLPWLVAAPPRSVVLWRPWPKAAWLVAGAAAAALAAGQVALANGPLDPGARARRLNRERIVGTTRPEKPFGARAFRWTGRTASFEWPVTAQWLVLRFWAPHPDVAARPVHVAITTACGVVFDGDLHNPEVVSLALRLPRDLSRIGASFDVSHTWQPSSSGNSSDTRELGVGVSANFTWYEGHVKVTHDLSACRPDLSRARWGSAAGVVRVN